MFPHPINALSSLIAQIPTIKVSTKKQDKVKSIPIVRTKLRNLCRLFFPPFISIGEISSGFCLYQEQIAKTSYYTSPLSEKRRPLRRRVGARFALALASRAKR